MDKATRKAINNLMGVPPADTAPMTDDEVAELRATTNEREWNAAVTLIEQRRDGHSPPDWFARVQASGLHHEIVSGWTGQT